MKNSIYFILVLGLILYLYIRGKEEINNEGQEPENFIHAVRRGFYESVESIKKFHKSLAPEKPENQPEHEVYGDVKPPNSEMGDINPFTSAYKGWTPKKRRGMFLISKIDQSYRPTFN